MAVSFHVMRLTRRIPIVIGAPMVAARTRWLFGAPGQLAECAMPEVEKM
jgi:hypothetical protein